MQFDVRMPFAVDAEDFAEMLSQTPLARHHSIAARLMDDGTMRVIVASPVNAEIADAENLLRNLVLPTENVNLQGEYAVTLSNIIFAYSDVSREEISLMNSTLTFAAPTGIASVTNTKDNGQLYNLQGQKVSDGYNGVTVINGKKYINK